MRERERANIAEEFSTSSDHAPDAETGESDGLQVKRIFSYLQKPTVRISVLTLLVASEARGQLDPGHVLELFQKPGAVGTNIRKTYT